MPCRESWSYSGGGSVVQSGVSAPADTLIWWELAGALAFEEEDAFSECIAVILATGDECGAMEEEKG